jgi:hypothetical protein
MPLSLFRLNAEPPEHTGVNIGEKPQEFPIVTALLSLGRSWGLHCHE